MRNPHTLYGLTQDEVGHILGDGWRLDTYGSNGLGWKYINNSHPDLMVFNHAGGGVHVGSYYGVTGALERGKITRIKIVGDSRYLALPGDKAKIIYLSNGE